MYSRSIPICLCLILLIAQRNSVAQEIHAITDEGKHVLLSSDGSWHYAKRDSKSPGASFYTDEKGHFTVAIPKTSDWRASDHKLLDDAEFSFIRRDEKCYGMIVTESLPLTEDDIISLSLARLDSTNGSVVSDKHVQRDGLTFRELQCDMTIKGMTFRYSLDVYTSDDWYVKIVSWAFKSIALKNPELLTELPEYVKINKP